MKTRQNIEARVYDKRGRLLAIGHNSYIKTHPLQKRYAMHTSKPNRPFVHAEFAALIKARRNGKPHRIVVERRSKKGHLMPACPCDGCMKAIRDFGIKEISWS